MGNRIDVVRFPAGVSTGAETEAWGQLGLPDPTKWNVLYDDFHRFLAADWVVTETQAGATQALTAGDGGLLLFTNSAADDDLVQIQWAGSAGAVMPNFTFTSGKRLAFGARFQTSDATQTDIAFGLYIADTTPIASVPADGIYILKADGGTSFVMRAGNTSSYAVSSSFGTLANATNIDIQVVYDGIPYVVGGVTTHDFDVYINGAKAATLAAPAANVPSANLALSIVLQNGEAVAKTLTIDRLWAVKER